MQPTSILGDVRGMARDYSLDQLPKGYVWDLVDYIPRRRGAKLDARGPWKFLTPALDGRIWGGYQAPFRAGTSLLVGTTSSLWEIDPLTGAASNKGALFPSLKQNGVMLRDRVYFAHGDALERPKYVTRSGATVAAPVQLSSGQPANVMCVFKDRLVTAGDPALPSRIAFSPLETKGGPPGTWDVKSFIDSSLAVTGLWPMGAQILVFHNGSIEKIRGGIPPETSVDSDMYLDPFTEQMGCNDPASIVGWQENVLWAAPRGVYLSDGSTNRSLTEQGGIADLWRTLYAAKRSGTQVVCAVFLDLLFVSVLTDFTESTPTDLRPFTLVCNLTDRSWYRFANVAMTAAIPSQIDGEQVWWAPSGYGHAAAYGNRIAEMSPMLFIERDPADTREPYPRGVPADAIDGNAVPVLPQVETAFARLGPEGVKRARNVHVSHTTVQATPSATNLLRVSYRLRPWPFAPYIPIGDIPGKDDYKRNRLRLGKRGYGIAVKVEQIVPSYLSRLHDIGVEEWAQDRGNL